VATVTDITPRLSRAEKREETRARLLDAAESVFAEKGIGSSSIEDITDRAGFSRGAFYSNFDTKDALVGALLERHIAVDAADMQELFDNSADAGDFFARLRDREQTPGRHALSLEFILYAVRNPEARPEVARLLAISRQTTVRLIEQQWEASGIEHPPIDVLEAAKVIEALDDGLDLQRLIDPEGFPLGMFTDVLVLLQEAVVALTEKQAGSSGSR